MRNLFKSKSLTFLAIAAFLVGGFFVATGTAFAVTVADQIDQYTSNDASFTRSLTAGTGNIVSQTTNPDGSVVMNINGATGGADSGFYTKSMKLGDVKSVTVTGSGSFGVNIWLDKNSGNDIGANGKFFTWNGNGNVFVSTDGDGFFSEGSSVPNGNGVLTINDSSSFHSYAEDVAPYNPSITLAELKTLYPNADITFWVGTSIASGGGSKSATILTFNVELSGELSAQDFGVWNQSNVIGYSAGFKLTDVTFTGATSIVVQLYSGSTLLQTDTAKNPAEFPGLIQISSPFNVMGTFNYVSDNYWTNVRGTEYGQTMVPTKVVATVTLANGKVVTAENTNPPTGDLTIISNAGTLAAGVFGVMDFSNVKGYSAEFNLTDATLANATSIVVKLYSGDTVLQTNTSTGKLGVDYSAATLFSSPFDVLGSFDYPADGYWTNVRGSEYGKNLVPTKVVATVTLANGKEVTAEKTNPTGDTTIIVPPGSLAAQDFGVWNQSGVIGYSAGFNLTDANFTGATVVVKLYSGETLLQTNTATTTGFTGLTGISSPFDVFGTFPYVTDGYWTNVRGVEYGQTMVPTKVVATVTLVNGKTITATNSTLTGGDLTNLGGSIAAENFGVDSNTGLGQVNGYATGFGLTDADFTGAQSVVVKLYATGDQLLQTNTLIGAVTGTQISSPFDVMGTFNYGTDGYWTNLRAVEYGQTLAPTKVVATVTLSNGKIVTATNESPTGEYSTILVTAKLTAHDALTTAFGTYTQANYTAENWTTLIGFKSAGDIAIDTAIDSAGVSLAKTTATTGMAGVKTIAQTAADDAATLSTAKATAHTALTDALAIYTVGNYTEANWTALNKFKSNGDAAIDVATTLSDVSSAQSAATDGMAGVETIAQTAAAYTPTPTPAPSTGGGGGYVQATCSSVIYSEWGSVFNGLQYRSVLSQTPNNCSLSSSQIAAESRPYVASVEPISSQITPVSETPQTSTATQQVLGVKVYADGTLLKGTNNKIYVVKGNALQYIPSLKELAKYKGQILKVDDATISSFSQAAVLGEKKYADGTLLRGTDNRIYVIIGGKLQYISTLKELAKYRGAILKVSDSEIASFAKTAVLEVKKYADGTLLRGLDKKVYVLVNGQKQHIRSLKELAKYARKSILDVKDEVIAQY